uniref:AAA+ ATPase domain-containing protein n=1 Tax=viral metagenome TaxID=1070528 RepID=A0A6C0CBS9_9ZZZZ
MSKNDHLPWIEKYRPKNLQDLVQDPKLIDIFTDYITTGNMSHLLFYGPPGTGKTSAILAICREIFKEYYSSRVIEFNASDDRGINAVRDKISNEAKKMVSNSICSDGTMIPAYKVIILDEADAMTDEAQDALRVIIEKFSSVTRFCFICNYICKITDAIKSRCYSVYFKKLEIPCIIEKLNLIAKKENILLQSNIYDYIVEISNGDMRKAIMMLQNLKYFYYLKKKSSSSICNLSIKELKNIDTLYRSDKFDTEDITEKEVYNLFAYIDKEHAGKIITRIMIAKSVCELVKIGKNIMALGYPIDNVLSQMTSLILSHDKISDLKKAVIIKYSSKILYRMKMSSNEYIQLLDYITYINNICKSKDI